MLPPPLLLILRPPANCLQRTRLSFQSVLLHGLLAAGGLDLPLAPLGLSSVKNFCCGGGEGCRGCCRSRVLLLMLLLLGLRTLLLQVSPARPWMELCSPTSLPVKRCPMILLHVRSPPW